MSTRTAAWLAWSAFLLCATPLAFSLVLLLLNGPWMLAYDVAYVTYASLNGRTLAPLRGRLRRTLAPGEG